MRKPGVALTFGVIFTFFILGLGVYYLASARSSGMSGYSVSGCAPCHSSSASATVTVSIGGPTNVIVEETNTYTISVTGGPSGAFGFDLSATEGTILVTDSVNTQLKDGDLTHTTNGVFQSSWLFDWKAPSSPGTVTMNVAALSADGDGKGYSDDLWNLVSLSITVEAAPPELQPPVASFTFSPIDPDVDETVTFDASASSDPDGTIMSYEWDFGDGASDTGEIALHAYSSAETYTVTLTVTDDDGLTDVATSDVTVSPLELQAPVASFTFSPLSPVVGGLVTFDASGSSDPDGTIVSFEWDLGDGSFGSGVTDTHTYSSADDYTVTLVVVDSDGLTDTEEKMVTVRVAILHDIAIKDVTVFPNLIVAGDSVDISVTLENQGMVEETFDVNVYFDSNLIETNVNIVLASGSETTESFTWNTAGVADGIYAISAQVPEIEGEIEVDDNSFVNGTVKVTSILSLTLDVDPDSLNRRSRGRWITAYIELPDEYNASDIDLSSVLLNGSISAELKPAEGGDYDNDGTVDLMVKFIRAALIELMENATSDRIILNVGCQVSGTFFEGYDSIRKISHG